MSNYECAFITEAGDPKLLKSVEDLIIQHGGQVTNKDEWGERNFAYRIGKLSQGHYHIWTFSGSTRLKDLKDRLNIEEGVIRYLILKTS
jgi:small subunit ribosomal protein S6